MKRYFFLILFFTLNIFAQDKVVGPHIQIHVLAPQVFSSQEETLMALYFEPEENWHVYWKNPGDSGAAPKFSFKSESATIGPVLWPFPARIPLAHLTNLGYVGAVAYPFSVTPKNSFSVEISMDLEWLVCEVECVPGFAKIKFKRPVHGLASKWNSKDLEIVRKFSTRIPASMETAPFQITRVDLGSETLKLSVSGEFKNLQIFPLDGEFVTPAAPEKSLKTGEFIFKTNPAAKVPSRFRFVGAIDQSAWEFESHSESSTSLWLLILFAIIGGFLLNLMPCVFPVISIKAFSLLKTESSERVRDCLMYSLGVLTTFLCLGGIFLIFRSMGAAVGWGFQLQSPIVIFALILLFWLMALNFLGVFEVGTSTMGFAGQLSKNSSSFATGALSVFIATPCTAPFMGTALGVAVTLPAVSALMIFLGLGIGLALPFILFAISPRILSWLPKPGAWMERLKQFFAFPLFATVLWLMWVLGQQTQTQGWFLSGLALLIISFALWLGKSASGLRRILVWIFTLSLIGWVGYKLNFVNFTAGDKESSWQTYDEKELVAARAKGQAVFIDFTAAWCITCQVNKQTVLDTDNGQEAFRKANVLLMRADWTRYDAVITQALLRLGRSSVPVYAFYPSDGSEPILLPQILTLSMIKNLK